MNISPLTIYLWQLADRVLTWTPYVAGWSFVLLCVAIIILMIFGHDAAHYEARVKKGINDEEEAASCGSMRSHASRCVRWFSGVFGVALLGLMLIPDSNTIAMMVVIPEIAHSKAVQTDLPDIYNAAVKALKDQLSK